MPYVRKVIFVAILSFAISFTYGERNLQREEPHYVQVPTHPVIDENALEPDPFVPTKVLKPPLPTVTANCKCGEHASNDTVNEQTQCGKRPWQSRIKVDALVANGNLTDISQFPWVAALIERTSNGSAVHFCGGTLISSRLVLSAIHCFKGRSVSRIEVWLNERNLLLSTDNDHPTHKIKAQRLIVHPDYNPIWNYNDIVIVELSEAVDIQKSYFRPICLPRDEAYDQKEYAYTAGWGRISFNGPKSKELMHVCLPLITHDICSEKSVSYYKKRVTDHMICAGDVNNGGRDACPGDSGGPLFVESGDERRYFLVGIVSWGEQCALPRRPGVYTRVSKYLAWIYKEMSNIEDNERCG